jgi:hypothetical protein
MDKGVGRLRSAGRGHDWCVPCFLIAAPAGCWANPVFRLHLTHYLLLPLLLLVLFCVPQVGDRVKKGATLGYIEQLGTFVEVKVRCNAVSGNTSCISHGSRLAMCTCVCSA